MSDLTDSGPVLSVRNLRVCFPTTSSLVPVVDGIDLEVARGERFGLVGESGSGKSVTALSLLGLIDPPGTVTADHIVIQGRQLVPGDDHAFRRIRGREVALVMQDPLASLSPLFTIGDQLTETIRHHHGVGQRAALAEAVSLLASVGLPAPSLRTHDYPHQLSGGMRQRVAIALALACRPALLIADEPTTALDVTIRAQVIELLIRLSEEHDMAVLMITHDLGLLAGFAHEVAVMYAGRIVERSHIDALYDESAHPYTRALLASQPRISGPRPQRLQPIPGQPPNPSERPAGCAFHPRCALRQHRSLCVESEPELRTVGRAGQQSACHFAQELVDGPTAPIVAGVGR